MSRIYLEFFYLHSIPEMLLWGVLLVGAWTAAAIFFRKKKWDKAWKTLNRVVLAVVVLFILYWTIGKRNPAENGVSLIPFISFIEAQKQPERYRSVVASILLFIPVGISFPFTTTRSHPVRRTILFAAVLSVFIELMQWKWGLGLAETDDVIMNTLGAGFGTLAFFFSRSSL